jgi:hypothetical protein
MHAFAEYCVHRVRYSRQCAARNRELHEVLTRNLHRKVVGRERAADDTSSVALDGSAVHTAIAVHPTVAASSANVQVSIKATLSTP